MIQTLPGFRDFYPADCAARNYVFDRWREVARRYGFVEYDGPTLESVDLYRKKSGGELLGQLFDFTDKGEREITLRPEMTPTLARMVAARDRDFRKPLKWFSIASFFRYEKQQKGRLREFYHPTSAPIATAPPPGSAAPAGGDGRAAAFPPAAAADGVATATGASPRYRHCRARQGGCGSLLRPVSLWLCLLLT